MALTTDEKAKIRSELLKRHDNLESLVWSGDYGFPDDAKLVIEETEMMFSLLLEYILDEKLP